MAETFGEGLAAARKALGYNQWEFSYLCEGRVTNVELSLAENGWRKLPPDKERIVQKAIAGCRRFKKIHGKDKMKDIRNVREQLRKMGTGDPEPIPQQWGAEFIAAWCGRVGLAPREFAAMAQLRPTVAEADLISAPCQRWVRALIAAVDQILDGETFDAYAKKFESRAETITKLANDAFAGLIREVGREKMLEYLHALLLTGELKQAPRDLDEN